MVQRGISMKKIVKTITEKKIFTILENVVSRNPTLKNKTELRVAGGWVRDKILGINSDDIDISIKDMTGKDFAKILRKQLNQDNGHFPDSYVVKLNPAKSKHLETAAVKVDNVWIDFVHLRGEVYNIGDGRIPSTTFATPQEDVRRRDFTINSLFYNIHTKSVEDFSGYGVSDINDKIIRTTPPRSPSDVLLEDPLRAYRALRFANTLNFTIADELKDALLEKNVHDAVLKKVSRERITTELIKTLCLPKKDALRGLGMLNKYNLGGLLFGSENSNIYVDNSEHYKYNNNVFNIVCKKVAFILNFVPNKSNEPVVDIFSYLFSAFLSTHSSDCFLSRDIKSIEINLVKPTFNYKHKHFLQKECTSIPLYIKMARLSSHYFLSIQKNYNYEDYLFDKFRGIEKDSIKKASNIYKASLVFPIERLSHYLDSNNIIDAKIIFVLWLCNVRLFLENERGQDVTDENIIAAICLANISDEYDRNCNNGSSSNVKMDDYGIVEKRVKNIIQFYQDHNLIHSTFPRAPILNGKEIIDYVKNIRINNDKNFSDDNQTQVTKKCKKSNKRKKQILLNERIRTMKDSLIMWTAVNNVLESEGLANNPMDAMEEKKRAYEFINDIYKEIQEEKRVRL